MKKIISYTFISIIYITSISAQSEANFKDKEGRKQGFWVVLDSAKKKVYEGHFVDDIAVGKFTYYYSIGTKKSEATYLKNGTVVYAKMYDLGGKFIGEGKYVNEKKDSIWKFYAATGELLSEENYVNGVKNGVCKIYYPNGNTVESKNWKNGVADGPCKKYFNNGVLRYDGNYKNNMVDGELKFYFTNGQLYAKGKYVKDVKDGEWIFYTKEGAFDRKELYANGRLLSEDLNIISKEQQQKERLQYQEQTEKEGNENPHVDPYK
jgi:antitoxin component YwqK of YwqJK toxin-antitoxin module